MEADRVFVYNLLSVYPQLSRLALQFTANHDDARDLLQDTVLRMLSNKDKYVEPRNFKGWAVTVMRNIFINDYHRGSRVIVSDDVVSGGSVIDTSRDKLEPITPDDVMSHNEILDIVGMLPQVLRDTFGLYLSGYAYQEIARRQGIPVGTVKSRIFSAKRWLKKHLADFM